MDEEAFDSLGDSDLDGSPGSSPFRAEAMRDGLPVSARGFSQVNSLLNSRNLLHTSVFATFQAILRSIPAGPLAVR